MYTICPGFDIVLEDRYGVLLVNDGDEKTPVPRYILGIQSSRTILDTRDRSEFARALQGIRKGSRVIRYDSCTVPRSYGLTGKQLADFEKMIRDADLIMPRNVARITCYCSYNK